jgi:hypothetical protein
MNLLAIFAVSLFLLTVFGATIAAKLWSDTQFKKLLLWIPICLLAAVGTFKTINGVMGWPSEHLPLSFQLFDYRTDGKIVYVWGVEKGDKVPRTWKTPYDKKLHEELEHAKQEVGKGKKMQIEKQGPKKSADGMISPGEWQAHELLLQNQIPLKSQ